MQHSIYEVLSYNKVFRKNVDIYYKSKDLFSQVKIFFNYEQCKKLEWKKLNECVNFCLKYYMDINN